MLKIRAKTIDDGYSYSKDIGKIVTIINFVSIGGNVYAVCMDKNNKLFKKSIEHLEVQDVKD